MLQSVDVREDAIKPNVADVLTSMDVWLKNENYSNLLEPVKSARVSVGSLLTPIQ